MNEVEILTNTSSNEWASFITTMFAVFFLIIAVIKGFQFLAGFFGCESKTERRLKALESKNTELIAEIEKLKVELVESENRCMNEITKVKKEFDDRENQHWNESKVIKSNMDSKLDIILEKLEKQESLDFKNLRHEIVKAGESYINKGYVTIRQLRSLEELYDEYTETYDGNSYVETLMVKVRALEVIGKLNEHGEDIE